MSTMTDPFSVASKTSEPEGGRTANQRYTAAQTALREAHADEFKRLLEAEYEKDGVEYRPRRTAEEREALELERKRAAAEEKIRKIKEQFPDLQV